MTLPDPPSGTKHCPGRPGYAIAMDGSLWSCRTVRGKPGGGTESSYGKWKPRKQATAKAGYKQAILGGKLTLVHRLVLEAFVGPCPEGMQACHNDGNPSNNCLHNLRWDTAKSNHADKVSHGTMPRGRTHPANKLTEAQVHEIRTLAGTIRQKDIGLLYGIRQCTVCEIVNRKIWAHLPEPEKAS